MERESAKERKEVVGLWDAVWEARFLRRRPPPHTPAVYRAALIALGVATGKENSLRKLARTRAQARCLSGASARFLLSHTEWGKKVDVNKRRR